MPIDRLKGLFTKDGLQLKTDGPRKVWPHFEEDERGFVTPYNFDNDEAIQMYEENLEDLFDHYGLRHDGVSMCASGLAALYDAKAGVEKEAMYYEKAAEYLAFSQASILEMFGPGGYVHPRYMADQYGIEKLAKKKEKRLAKMGKTSTGAPPPAKPGKLPVSALGEVVPMQHPALSDFEKPASKVMMIRVSTGSTSIEQVEFTFSDGSVLIFGAPGEFALAQEFKPKAQGVKNPFGAKDKAENQKEDPVAIPGEPFFIGDDAYLVGVITHEKQDQKVLKGISFHTTSGRRSKWYYSTEEGRGLQHSYFAVKGHHVTGLAQHTYSTIATPVNIVQEAIRQDQMLLEAAG